MSLFRDTGSYIRNHRPKLVVTLAIAIATALVGAFFQRIPIPPFEEQTPILPPTPEGPASDGDEAPPTPIDENFGDRWAGILGLDWEDPYIGSLLTNLGRPSLSHNHGSFWHYCFLNAGMDLAFDIRDRLYSVRFLTDRVDGYSTCRFKLPGGIRFDAENLGRNHVRRELRKWRQYEDNGDTDCYPGHGDELCISYQEQQILGAVFKPTESHPIFAGNPLFRGLSYDSQGASWPPAPALPTLQVHASSMNLAP